MKVLYLDSGILGERSVSRIMTERAIARIKAEYPDADVTYRDFATDPVPHLAAETAGEWQALMVPDDPASPPEQTLSRILLDEFLAADIVLIGASLYNLTVPSTIKAWLDRIVIVGKTFSYTPEGQLMGLMGHKRAIVCISRGGFYAEGHPSHEIEHCEKYMRSILGFMGIEKIDMITADGTSVSPETREQALASVDEQIAALKF